MLPLPLKTESSHSWARSCKSGWASKVWQAHCSPHLSLVTETMIAGMAKQICKIRNGPFRCAWNSDLRIERKHLIWKEKTIPNGLECFTEEHLQSRQQKSYAHLICCVIAISLLLQVFLSAIHSQHWRSVEQPQVSQSSIKKSNSHPQGGWKVV